MKGSEMRMTAFMEGADKRYIIYVFASPAPFRAKTHRRKTGTAAAAM